MTYWNPQQCSISAVRLNSCFTTVNNGRCSASLPSRLSLTDCCCGIGKGWGEEEFCQTCPERNSGKKWLVCVFIYGGLLKSKLLTRLFRALHAFGLWPQEPIYAVMHFDWLDCCILLYYPTLSSQQIELKTSS